jgi:tRNA pseudouridine55 synthase
MTPALHGILVIDKPASWTSHDVVGWVRRWANERKVGHAGTLDPAATGVLPVAINDGTRVLEFLSDATKAYRAEITFGIETDSADGDGTVTAQHDVTFSDAELDHALEAFRGAITQQPPAHSAIKIGGKRAYELTRSGAEVEIPARKVTIFALDVVDWNGETLTVDIDCSKGTYLRSIARDLGAALGSGAYLSDLVRTRSGPFDLCDVWTIAELEALDPREHWPSIAEHPDSALPDWPAIVLSEKEAEDWRHGRPVPGHDAAGKSRARVYDNSGHWRGLADHDQVAGVWKALRVINPQ